MKKRIFRLLTFTLIALAIALAQDTVTPETPEPPTPPPEPEPPVPPVPPIPPPTPPVEVLPEYLQNERSNNTCLMCLIQNEVSLKDRLGISAKNINFYSFCIYQNVGQCCLMQPNGEAYTDDEVCSKGVCSHQGIKEIESDHLNQQYFFCNLTRTFSKNDVTICGNTRLSLQNVTFPSRALKVYFDPSKPNGNNLTNQTGNGSKGNDTNGTKGNDTNGTKGNDTKLNGTNQTYGNESTKFNGTNSTGGNRTNQTTPPQPKPSENTTNNINTTTNSTTNSTPIVEPPPSQPPMPPDAANSTGGRRFLQKLSTPVPKKKYTTSTANILPSTADPPKRALTDTTDSTIRLCTYDLEIDEFIRYNKLKPNADGKTYNYTPSWVNSTEYDAENPPPPISKVIYLDISSSGEDHLIYFFNQNQTKLEALSSEVEQIRVSQNNSIGLLGVFDISDTIAVSVTYQLVLRDADYIEPEHHKKGEDMPSKIIFAITISSIFGILVLVLGTIFVSKVCCRKKTLMITMDNDIQFKGRDQVHKLITAKRQPSGEISEMKPSDIEPLSRTVKISDLMASQENYRKIDQRTQQHQSKVNDERELRSQTSKPFQFLTVEDLRRQTGTDKTLNSNMQQQTSMHMIENFSKDHYQYIVDNQYQGPTNPTNNPSVKKKRLSDDDDDLLSHGSIKQTSKGGHHTTLSGKNTTKIITNDDYGEESKQVEDEDIDDSQTRLNKELEGVQREKPRPKTAGNKVDDENVFYKRPNMSNVGYKSTQRERTNGEDVGILDADDELHAVGGMRNERISKTITEEEGSSGGKRGPSFKRNRTIGNNEQEQNENSSEEAEDPLEDNSKKLQIFQSESKMDGADGLSMYEGGAEFATRPSKQNNMYINEDDDDDDDIRSGKFHTELREQFNNTKTTKKTPNGILKNTVERPMTAGQKRSDADEYHKRYDDYYQDANNMVFHTGTFNAEEDSESKKELRSTESANALVRLGQK